jgi:hypothetical protein
MLRTKRGAAAIPQITQVRAMLRNGVLPGTRACAVCRTETNSQCRVKVMCERVQTQQGPSQAEVAGCLLLAPLIGLWVPLAMALGLWAQRQNAGDEEAVIVPLPVCEACRPTLNDVNSLVKALRKIPDYAALLDRYREAEVTLVS